MTQASPAKATGAVALNVGAHELPTLVAPPVGLYRHYKGGWYEVVGAARCSETLQGMALYRPLYGDGLRSGALWVRPAAMFMESGEWDGRHQARFARWQIEDVTLNDLPAVRAVVGLLTSWGTQRGVCLETALRPPPPEPETCCERGCEGCVWSSFYDAVDRWRLDALALLSTQRDRRTAAHGLASNWLVERFAP